MLRILGKLNPLSGHARVPSSGKRRRRVSLIIPSLEGLEGRALLTVYGQNWSNIGDVLINTSGYDYANGKFQDLDHIASVDDSSNKTVSDSATGATGSYATSLKSTVSGPLAKSGSVVASGSINVSPYLKTGIYTWPSAGFDSEDVINILADKNETLTVTYSNTSSKSVLPQQGVNNAGAYLDYHANTSVNPIYYYGSGSFSVRLEAGINYFITAHAYAGYQGNAGTETSAVADAASSSFSWRVGPAVASPVIAMASAAITPDGQNVTAMYAITGKDLSSPGTIDFYWATGPNLSNKLGTARKVPTNTKVGTYTASTSIASLGIRPANATYILAVADSPNADPAHSVASVPFASDIVMDMATTTDARTVTATYDINTLNITQPLTFNIYRSSSASSYTQSNLIATDTLSKTDTTDLSVGHHQVKLNVYYASDMAPDPHRPFIIVVANPGKTVQEQSYSNDTSYFQKFVLGVVSHGYVPFLDDPLGGTQAWELDMASDLKKVDNYNVTIPFNWVVASRDMKPGQAIAAGRNLANQVAAVAASLESMHPGDVVDMHFIGHSRGSVVISQTILDLMASSPNVIKGSFIRMTMLDPHPATNYPNRVYYSAGVVATALTLKQTYLAFQAVAVDPPVIVPRVVNYAEVFFQHTPVGKFGLNNTESYLNLWGQGNDGIIINNSSINIAYHELTSQTFAGIGTIGHSEVHDYYRKFVIDQGISLTYT